MYTIIISLFYNVLTALLGWRYQDQVPCGERGVRFRDEETSEFATQTGCFSKREKITQPLL